MDGKYLGPVDSSSSRSAGLARGTSVAQLGFPAAGLLFSQVFGRLSNLPKVALGGRRAALSACPPPALVKPQVRHGDGAAHGARKFGTALARATIAVTFSSL